MRASVLATAEQLAAEAILRSLLADQEVRSAMQAEEARLRSCPIAAESADARARLHHAIATWTGGLVMRLLSGDPLNPAILLTTDNTPRGWFGCAIPATGAAGDNPDHIYRNAFLDGRGRYRIHGRLDLARRPTQFSIEVTRGDPARVAISAAGTGGGVRTQIDLVIDEAIATADDGRFTIELGGESDGGPNHLRLADEPVSLVIRDVVSDWAEQPAALRIERVDRPSEGMSDYAATKARLLAALPDYLSFWSGFPQRWMGGVPQNGFKPPVPRDGGWGWQAGVRHALAPGRCVLVTMRKGRSAYLGVQSCDPWFLGPDAHRHVSSLNAAQADPHDGDLFTFVIAPDDPGVANWIDTGGLHDGLAVLRWQAVPPGEPVGDYLPEVRFLDRAVLDRDYPHLRRLDAAARDEQRRRHADDYRRRYAARVQEE